MNRLQLQGSGSSSLTSIANSPESPKVDEFGMWIVGDQLFVGYGLVHNVTDIIELCHQTAQYINVCSTISKAEELAKFEKVLEHRLENIRSGTLEVNRDVTNRRLKDLMLRCLESTEEISPLLKSSIDAHLVTGNENSQRIAAQNRDCLKQQLLEVLRDLVILLQLLKNGKPLPEVDSLLSNSLSTALEWLRGESSVLSNVGLEAIRACIKDGQKLSSLLNTGLDKGELMAACSKAEAEAERFRDLHSKGQDRTFSGDAANTHLSQQLSHLHDTMIEVLSRKTLDEFLTSDLPIELLEKSALIAHFKPHRESAFTEKRVGFEEQSKHMLVNMEMCCKLGIVCNPTKADSVHYLSTQLAALTPQVVRGAQLLHGSPYNDTFKDNFSLLKRAWLSGAGQLRSSFLSAAKLRTFQKQRDNRAYITHSTISTVKAVDVATSTNHQHTSPVSMPIHNTEPLKFETLKESPTWESADKDLVQAARKLAMIICRLTHLAREEGFSREELLKISKDVVRACQIVSRLTKQLASECTDRRTQTMLTKFCERISTFSTQLKMVCTVKAATLGNASGSTEDEEATEMLLENARNLMASVRETVRTAAAASITIRVASGQHGWW